MDEKQRQDERRKRLSQWLTLKGGPHAAAHAAGVPQSVETQISRVLGGYVFSNRAARSLEIRLDIPRGYLDNVGELPNSKEAANTLSAFAIDLGELLDMIPDKITRVEAYNAASKEILSRLKKPDTAPND
jgi:hypothetical protein